MGVARLGQGWVVRKLEAGLPLVVAPLVAPASTAAMDASGSGVAPAVATKILNARHFQRFRRLESIITVLDERQDSRRRQQGARAGVCSACGVRRLPTRHARVWCSGCARARSATRAGSGAAAR